jgi:hypothetical protein
MSKFILKDEVVKPTLSVAFALGNKPTKGEVGLEIEVEGTGLLHEEEGEPLSGLPQWIFCVDHSLRGEENAEYVLRKPLDFKDIPEALNKLYSKLADNGATFDDSNRTSVHVHLNCQDFHFNRLASLMALWYVLEEPLTEFCGEHRVGNLFCFRAVDTPAVVTNMRNFIRADGQFKINDIFHYAGLNPHALLKYGSLEFRTMRGCHSAEEVMSFVRILERLYRLSAEFPDPRDVVAGYSSGGPISHFNILLGDCAQSVRDAIGWTDSELSGAIFRGVRLAQTLCYCRDWDVFKALTIKDDPFGRDRSKVAKKVVAQAGAVEAIPPAPLQSLADVQWGVPEYDEQPSPEPGIDFNAWFASLASAQQG